jgi:hypothetical protein
LLDEVDFAIEVEDFSGEGAALVLAGGELGEEQGEGVGCGRGAGDVAEGDAVEEDGNAGVGWSGVGRSGFAEEDFAGGVEDADVGAEGVTESDDGGVVGRAGAEDGFEGESGHRLRCLGLFFSGIKTPS